MSDAKRAAVSADADGVAFVGHECARFAADAIADKEAFMAAFVGVYAEGAVFGAEGVHAAVEHVLDDICDVSAAAFGFPTGGEDADAAVNRRPPAAGSAGGRAVVIAAAVGWRWRRGRRGITVAGADGCGVSAVIMARLAEEVVIFAAGESGGEEKRRGGSGEAFE